MIRKVYSNLKASVYFDQFPNYCQMINDAKSLARRSILIDHCGVEHIDLTEDFRNIEHVYSIEKETKRGISRLSLIEFKTEAEADNVAKQARHNEGLLPVPLKVFRYASPKTSSNPIRYPFPIDQVKISYKEELGQSVNSYSDLVSNSKMSLVALKMRFITLINFESVLCAGSFAGYELMPTGSSVIDIGSDSSDLDLVVTRREDHHRIISEALSNPRKVTRQERIQKLLHLDKSLYSESKDTKGIKGTMRWFDHILREYMPLTDGYGVVLVSRAKVPIIKFKARITSVDCDLSFNLGLDTRDRDIMTTSYNGIVMSQIMYSLCRNNNLSSALIVYLRIFAKLASITSKEPNIGFTNFQFLSIILFYLQQVTITSRDQEGQKVVTWARENMKPIVPPFKNLLEPSFRIERVILSDKELNQVLPELIEDFFDFYSSFDFDELALNLYEGEKHKKLDNSSIYVVNPLDRTLNICRNVNRKGLDMLIKGVKHARTLFKSEESPLQLINMLQIEEELKQEARPKVRLLRDKFDNDKSRQIYHSPIGDISQKVCS